MVEVTTTGDGTLRLDEAIDWPCDGCGQRRDCAEVFVNHGDGRPVERLCICGQCIAGALAVRLAAAHVRAGGSMADLSRADAGQIAGTE